MINDIMLHVLKPKFQPNLFFSQKFEEKNPRMAPAPFYFEADLFGVQFFSNFFIETDTPNIGYVF